MLQNYKGMSNVQHKLPTSLEKEVVCQILTRNGEGITVRSEVRPWGIQLLSLVLNTRKKQISTIPTSLLPMEKRWRPYWKMGTPCIFRKASDLI